MPAGRTLWDRRIEARDGVELAADVFLPHGTGPFATVVLRTPYMRGRTLNNPRGWIRLVDYGYAFVAVDVRGRNDSDGSWTPWVKDTADAFDVIEWTAQQSWCNNQVGMVGGSYEGLTQWWTAEARPPHLKCIAPLCVGSVAHRVPMGTGIPMQYWLWWLTLVMGRTRQNPGAPSWEDNIARIPLEHLDEVYGVTRSAWQRFVAGDIEFGSDTGAVSLEEHANIDIPVLIGVGWWDDQEAMHSWQALQRAKSAQDCRLLIGAWDHAGNIAPRPMLGGVDVSASAIDTIGYIEQFLAWHLKGERTAIAEAPRCRIFLTGENRWEDLEHWPHPEATEVPLFLASDGDARGLRGSGRLTRQSVAANGSDTYIYDPNRPGRDLSNLSAFAWADPPLDHRYLQRRNDCLVYTSEPLETPMLVSGLYRARIFLSSDRVDTDIYVMLSDVHPDGRAIGLAATNEMSGCLRLRYRNGSQAEMLVPGTIYEVTVDGSWVHHLFKQGHRVRITLSSGNFPLMARNAGTGRHWAEDEQLLAQTNTIHHCSRHPSQVLLPVAPAGAR